MEQKINIEQGQVTVDLEGKIYVEEATRLREKLLALLAQGQKKFRINMRNVVYIDSSGLGVLVAIQKRTLEHGGGVVIMGLNGPVKEIFELTRLNKVFTII